MVERRLPKPKVAGSNPVFRSPPPHPAQHIPSHSIAFHRITSHHFLPSGKVKRFPRNCHHFPPVRLRPVCSSGNSQALPSLRDGPLPLEPRAASHFRRTHRASAVFATAIPSYSGPDAGIAHGGFTLTYWHSCIYVKPGVRNRDEKGGIAFGLLKVKT